MGTSVGLIPWVLLYVGLGAAGHELLTAGGDFDELLALVIARVSLIADSPLFKVGAVVLTALLVYVLQLPPGATSRGRKHRKKGNPKP